MINMVRWMDYNPLSGNLYMNIATESYVKNYNGDWKSGWPIAIIDDLPRNEFELDMHLMLYPSHNIPNLVSKLRQLSLVNLEWEKGEFLIQQRGEYFVYRVYKENVLHKWG